MLKKVPTPQDVIKYIDEVNSRIGDTTALVYSDFVEVREDNMRGEEGETEEDMRIFITGLDVKKFNKTPNLGDTFITVLYIGSIDDGEKIMVQPVVHEIADDGSVTIEIIQNAMVMLPRGERGQDGTSAGFGTPHASATALSPDSDPTVEVTASGGDYAKVFDFTFGIPVGAKILTYNETIKGVNELDTALLEISKFNHTPQMNELFACIFDAGEHGIFYQTRQITQIQTAAVIASVVSSNVIPASQGDSDTLTDIQDRIKDLNTKVTQEPLIYKGVYTTPSATTTPFVKSSFNRTPQVGETFLCIVNITYSWNPGYVEAYLRIFKVARLDGDDVYTTTISSASIPRQDVILKQSEVNADDHSTNGLLAYKDGKLQIGKDDGETWGRLPYFATTRFTFATAGWGDIRRICADGEAKKYFNVGDEKVITFSGGAEQTLVILDFDHDKITGTLDGYASMTIGMKNAYANQDQMNFAADNTTGYKLCQMRNTLSSHFKLLPRDLQDIIKEVDKPCYNSGTSSVETIPDKLFLLSLAEICPDIRNTNYPKGEGTLYEYYRLFQFSDKQRFKYGGNGIGNALPWWVRSPLLNNTKNFLLVVPLEQNRPPSSNIMGAPADTQTYTNASVLGSSGRPMGTSFAFCI